MDKDVGEYIKKLEYPRQAICQELRRLILKTFPGVKEEMKWGAIVFAGGMFYIGALKDHVNLGFAISGLAKEEADLFEGKGRTMRHIKIGAVGEIDEERLVKLLKMVYKKSECKECR